ncbi:hypothetical protein ACIBKX_07920 [Streptomyces sp. NPDC050658]|uniref:hypothetical protein n=1 Tax=unclassified Streptomyces TaxID=2593676 RepID=UPI003416F1C6
MLVAGPRPLALDCQDLAGLPQGLVRLDELLDLLLHGHCPRATKDAVWFELVQRSRADGVSWTLACTGMALPALAGVSRRLAVRYPGDPADVQAEVLTGFLGALPTIDLGRPSVLVRLKWAAFRQGFAALSEALDAPTPARPEFESAPSIEPWGHPDLVLARAVRSGVLTRTEADLIGGTRLDRESVTDWAIAHKATAGAVYKARRRAECRLVAFIRDGIRTVSADDPVAGAVAADLAGPNVLQRAQRVARQPSRSVSDERVPAQTAAERLAPSRVSKGVA